MAWAGCKCYCLCEERERRGGSFWPGAKAETTRGGVSNDLETYDEDQDDRVKWELDIRFANSSLSQ